MTRKLRCRRCLAAGLLFSALLHGAATVWLSARPAATTRPDVRITELDLGIFAAAGPAPVTEAAGAPETEAAPAEPPPEPQPAIADTTEPQVAPEPEPMPEPLPMSEPEPEPALEPAPVAPIPALAEVEPVPEQAAQPRPPKPRVQVKRPVRKPQPKAVAKRKSDPVERKPEPAPKPSSLPTVAPKPSDGASQGDQVVKAGGDSRDSGARASSARRDAELAYLAELQRAIGRYQRFPDEARRRRKTGVATVAFVVTAEGRIREVRIHKTSGESSLDDAALKALQRLNRFKPIPEVIGRRSWSMRVPIRFDLR